MVEALYQELLEREKAEKEVQQREGTTKMAGEVDPLSLIFLRRAAPSLDVEYAFFMTEGEHMVQVKQENGNQTEEGELAPHRLNRFFASTELPRAESAIEDMATANGNSKVYVFLFYLTSLNLELLIFALMVWHQCKVTSSCGRGLKRDGIFRRAGWLKGRRSCLLFALWRFFPLI